MPLSVTHKETRVIIAGVFILILMLLLIGGLVYHQILKHDQFYLQSENNRIRVQPVIPKRGLIFDRNMQVIADNRLSFTISIVPFEMVEGVTVPRLAELLGLDTAEVEKRLRNNFISNYIPTPVKRGQDIEVIAILEEQRREYPGVTYRVESVRQYEQGVSAEAFIGHLGEISPEEIDKDADRSPRPGSMIGKKGIEKSYDENLRGIEGTNYMEITARGQLVGHYEGRPSLPAIPGDDIVLTIDLNLQRYIVNLFDSMHYSGAVVALDPRNGEVLALASFPGFDPNIFSGVISPEEWQEIISDSLHPLLNRPMAGLYPPGSTSKLLTAGAALELGLMTDMTTFKPCLGGMRFGDRFFRCWEPRGHGKLDVYGGIEQSCDVYFYQVGQLLGVDNFGSYAEKCGFGKETGIDIAGELKGIVPSSAYYNKVYGPRGWTHYLVLNLAIGQGEFTITPLQLAQFYCGIANDGVVFRPHLVKQLLHHDGSVENKRPEVSFRLPFSKRTLETLQKSAELVVHGERGTAKRLRNSHYRVAGKTGTAQNPHGNEHSWFVGYAPADDPRIVAVAIVENAGHGSEWAAPVVGKIFRQYLVKPDSILAKGGEKP